jgi:hypothetical protein
MVPATGELATVHRDLEGEPVGGSCDALLGNRVYDGRASLARQRAMQEPANDGLLLLF